MSEEFELDRYLDSSIYAVPDTPTESPSKSFSVSKIFYPGANISPRAQDLVIVSNDSVLFQVLSSVLLEASDNRFGSLIPFSKNLRR